jgi:hypothetical protein
MRLQQIMREFRRIQPDAGAVLREMVPQFVTVVDDCPHQLLVSGHFIGDQEKGGLRTVASELRQDSGCCLRVGAIVEGQRQESLLRAHPIDAAGIPVG